LNPQTRCIPQLSPRRSGRGFKAIPLAVVLTAMLVVLKAFRRTGSRSSISASLGPGFLVRLDLHSTPAQSMHDLQSSQRPFPRQAVQSPNQQHLELTLPGVLVHLSQHLLVTAPPGGFLKLVHLDYLQYRRKTKPAYGIPYSIQILGYLGPFRPGRSQAWQLRPDPSRSPPTERSRLASPVIFVPLNP